jgi:hypothetical protein
MKGLIRLVTIASGLFISSKAVAYPDVCSGSLADMGERITYFRSWGNYRHSAEEEPKANDLGSGPESYD